MIMLTAMGLAFAQSARYTEAMQKNIAALDSVRTKEGYQQLANTFERIANAERTEWHPYYYAGYALVMQGYAEQDITKLDPILDKADEVLAMAASLQANHSEITNVQAMVLQGRMRVDMSRAMTLGPKASEMLQKALGQQPSGNPRVMMNLAQNMYYTPEPFGGSKTKGLELMQKALAQYDSFQPATPLDPNWGKAYVARVLQQWTAAK